jgi:protein involved in polysaccharide export with SLBB domain
MKSRLLLFISGFFLCSISAVAQLTPTSTSTPRGYLIGSGDVLTIKALGEKDFDVDAITVDDDGKIQIPYISEPVMASCKTERELQAEIAQLWSKYLKNPQISVRVTQRNSRPPVSVTGEVTKESQFDLTRKTSLLEVLSAAGGTTTKNGGTIQLIRTRPPVCADSAALEKWKLETGELGVSTRIYSLAAVVQGSNEANPEIFPGDIIHVPKAAPVYVTGEVKKAGEFDLPAGGLPLTQAIAMASGKTSEAKKQIKIYRRKQGSTQPEIMTVNLEAILAGKEKDVMLQPYDIVEIGKAGESFAGFWMKVLTGIPQRIPIPVP